MLLHFDSPNAGQILRNDGYGGYVYNNLYENYVSDEVYKFGGYSLYFDQTYVHMGCNIALNDLPTGDYTLEFWFYRHMIPWNNSKTYPLPFIYGEKYGEPMQILNVADSSARLQYIYLPYSTHNDMYNIRAYNYAVIYNGMYGFTGFGNTWGHYALTYRYSDDFYTIYLNGKKCVTFQMNAEYKNDSRYNTGDTYNYWVIGNSSYGMAGYLDELRITEGIIYTGSSITVPTAPFT